MMRFNIIFIDKGNKNGQKEPMANINNYRIYYTFGLNIHVL